MSGFDNEPKGTIKPGSGGRKMPRTAERKAAATEKLVRLMEQNHQPAIKMPTRKEIDFLIARNKFAMLSRKERLVILKNKLRS